MDVAAQVMALRRGEDEAGSALVERYRPFVLGRLKAAARARNWFWLDDIEDATQEVLVRFVEAVRAGRFVYRDESQLKGFLVRTAFYAVMQRQDDHMATWSPDDEQAVARLGLDRVGEFRLPAFSAAAFDTLGRRECLEELYRAIDSLPEARAQVLRLTMLGLRPREIAPVMERSANAVSVLKTHALAELREALAETEFEANCGKYFLGERS